MPWFLIAHQLSSAWLKVSGFILAYSFSHTISPDLSCLSLPWSRPWDFSITHSLSLPSCVFLFSQTRLLTYAFFTQYQWPPLLIYGLIILSNKLLRELWKYHTITFLYWEDSHSDNSLISAPYSAPTACARLGNTSEDEYPPVGVTSFFFMSSWKERIILTRQPDSALILYYTACRIEYKIK